MTSESELIFVDDKNVGGFCDKWTSGSLDWLWWSTHALHGPFSNGMSTIEMILKLLIVFKLGIVPSLSSPRTSSKDKFDEVDMQ